MLGSAKVILEIHTSLETTGKNSFFDTIVAADIAADLIVGVVASIVVASIVDCCC